MFTECQRIAQSGEEVAPMCAMTMEQEQELTLAQAAGRLNVSVQTVKRRIEAGRIQARREGNEWRIQVSELQRYIRSTQTDEMKAVRPEEVEWWQACEKPWLDRLASHTHRTIKHTTQSKPCIICSRESCWLFSFYRRVHKKSSVSNKIHYD